MKILISVIISSLTLISAKATDDRIQVIEFNLGEVGKLYMAPGRASVVDFPCEIERVVKGPAGDFDARFDKEDNPKGLDLWLRDSASKPTNLIVKCESDVFVFDVIPSKHTHYEYIKIKRGHSRPQLKYSSEKRLIKSSDQSNSTLRLLELKGSSGEAAHNLIETSHRGPKEVGRYFTKDAYEGIKK